MHLSRSFPPWPAGPRPKHGRTSRSPSSCRSRPAAALTSLHASWANGCRSGSASHKCPRHLIILNCPDESSLRQLLCVRRAETEHRHEKTNCWSWHSSCPARRADDVRGISKPRPNWNKPLTFSLPQARRKRKKRHGFSIQPTHSPKEDRYRRRGGTRSVLRVSTFPDPPAAV